MRILVADVETSLHNVGDQAVGKFKAAPFHPDNWIVWLGIQDLNDNLTPKTEPLLVKFPTYPATVPAPDPEKEPVCIVGHNIKYDLEFLCGPGNTTRAEWIKVVNHPDTVIWDTQQAEFRLKSQSKISPSLDWCCEQRGWEVKPGRLKEYWEAGVSTEDIADEEVTPYLRHDVSTTGQLMADQARQAVELGMMPLLRTEMDAILATTVMEVNGMYFDKEGARLRLVDDLEPKYEAQYAELQELLAKELDVPVAVVNPNSNPFLTSYLYGGGWKWQQHELMYNEDGTPVLFKTGKRKGEHKTKVAKYEPELPKRVTATDKQIAKSYTSVDSDVLKKLIKDGKVSDVDKDILEKIRKLRDIKKLTSTYFDGYSKLVWPDGMIRTSLNHAIAATARLTSSSPNLQNAAHNEVRSYFQSRYEGGNLMEVDLSQIEVVVQAFLSQDPNMMADVINGIDFHCKRAALTAHMPYEEMVRLAKVEEVPEYVKARKGAKNFSFQRAYGAGVKAIADATGLSQAEVKAFIAAEEAEYPETIAAQERWIEEVTKSTAERDERICGEMVACTGARYRFYREKYKDEWQYKPTVIKNYPIQGLAGEILKLILAKCRVFLYHYNRKHPDKEPVLMVNTVHDSVIFDLPAWVDIPALAKELIGVFTSAAQDMSRRFNIDFNLPISADAESGTDWFSMKTVTGE